MAKLNGCGDYIPDKLHRAGSIPVIAFNKYRGVIDMFIGGSRSNPAPTRNTYSYGLEMGHVPKQLEAKTSVTLKVGLEEYISKLKQLERLVEEINRMEISIELAKH